MWGTGSNTEDEQMPHGRWRFMFGAHRSARWLLRAVRGLLVIAILVSALFYDRIAHPVYAGERGVKWLRFSGGTVLDRSFPEGMHFTFPWDRFMIYDIRIQELTQVSTIYAKDGLAITVTCSVRFRPTVSYLPKLHREIGPRYIEKVVQPEIVSSLRKVVGNYTPAEIYAKDEQGLLDELGTTLRKDLNSKYFSVTEFLVTELKLPQQLQQAIQRKLTEEQNELAYEFVVKREQQEKQRRIIEAEGLRRFEEISGLSVFTWRGLDVTEKLATSANAKVILMGTGSDQLPVILNADSGLTPSVRGEPTDPNSTTPQAQPRLGPSLPFVPTSSTIDSTDTNATESSNAAGELGPSLPFIPDDRSAEQPTTARDRRPAVSETGRTTPPR